MNKDSFKVFSFY